MTQPASGEPPTGDDDLRSDPDVPDGIHYDPDLAVHEPMAVPAKPSTPSRRRAPLLLFPLGLLVLSLIVYVLFGLIAHEGKSAADYIDTIRQGHAGAWQAAFELSRLIAGEESARRDARLVPELTTLITRVGDRDPRLRRYLILSLAELRDRRAIDPLLEAIADADTQARLYAIWGLGAIGEIRAAGRLLPLLDDPDAGVRKMTAYALGSLPAPGVTAGLRRVLHDPGQDVAWNAALALARLGDSGGLPLITRLLDRTYLDRVTDPDAAGRPRPLSEERKEEILINALHAVAELGNVAPLPLVRSLRDTDSSLKVRQIAFETLERLETTSR